jgi:acyl-CoA reductase-like NAD-dependent aldehyde dehydrogenase
VDVLLNDARLRKVSFTGSTEIGRLLLGKAARNVLRASLELGGNAPFLVFDDADRDAAVEGALVAKLRNGGQSCAAANRFLVQEPVAEGFAHRLATRMKAIPVGRGTDPSAQLGPLINLDQRRRMESLVEDAVAAGASAAPGQPTFREVVATAATGTRPRSGSSTLSSDRLSSTATRCSSRRQTGGSSCTRQSLDHPPRRRWRCST